MLSSKKQNIEDLVVELLTRHPYSKGVDLVKLVQEIRPKTVKQAVYTALSFLLKNEVVLKIGGKYVLSRVWINKINKLFQNKTQLTSDTIFKLKENESISYYFPSLLTCDTYWAHVFDILIEWITKAKPVIVWNPHEWFAIGRQETEMEILKQFTLKEKHAFYSIAGETPLDKNFKKNWTNEFISISTGGGNIFPHNYYFNVFDNVVIEVFINETLVKKIEDFYQSNSILTPEKISIFENLISEKYKVRMKISNNPKKAYNLRKKISKDFYIPKSLVL